MSSSSDAGSFSQRLLGRVQSEFPVLRPQLEQTIISLGAEAKDTNTFRKLLNQSLRQQIAALPVNTMEIRICLDDDDNLEYWYMNLTNTVLPFWSSVIKTL